MLAGLLHLSPLLGKEVAIYFPTRITQGHTYFSPLLLCGRSLVTSWWLLLTIPARIIASFLLVSGHKEPECPSVNHSLQLSRVPIAFPLCTLWGPKLPTTQYKLQSLELQGDAQIPQWAMKKTIKGVPPVFTPWFSDVFYLHDAFLSFSSMCVLHPGS